MAVYLKELYRGREKQCKHSHFELGSEPAFRCSLDEEQTKGHKQQHVAYHIKDGKGMILKGNPTDPRPMGVSLEITPRHRRDADDDYHPEEETSTWGAQQVSH